MLTSTSPSSVWSNNIVLVQLLSLTPMLAISQSAIKGIAVALCTSAVAIIAVIINRLLHSYIKPSLHFIWILFLVGSITTMLELLLQLTFFPLYRELGVYIPLISCNLALLIHLQQQYQFGNEMSYTRLLKRSVLMVAGLILALGVFSSLREILVFGTLFRDLELLTSNAGIPVDSALNSRTNQVLTFGLLQPGAFILFALALALHRWIDEKFAKPDAESKLNIEKVTRARVTGKI
jgi:Na+-translocating ferredoxin:NAD+ oxidoreductase subunit E